MIIGNYIWNILESVWVIFQSQNCRLLLCKITLVLFWIESYNLVIIVLALIQAFIDLYGQHWIQWVNISIIIVRIIFLIHQDYFSRFDDIKSNKINLMYPRSTNERIDSIENCPKKLNIRKALFFHFGSQKQWLEQRSWFCSILILQMGIEQNKCLSLGISVPEI